jgi:predicted secreted protein
MSITTVIAIYFLIWWITLFAVLPWGVRSQHESGDIAPGTDPGAPAVHRVWRALLWTTIIASAIFAVIAGAYDWGLIPFDWLARISTPPSIR